MRGPARWDEEEREERGFEVVVDRAEEEVVRRGDGENGDGAGWDGEEIRTEAAAGSCWPNGG